MRKVVKLIKHLKKDCGLFCTAKDSCEICYFCDFYKSSKLKYSIISLEHARKKINNLIDEAIEEKRGEDERYKKS